MTPMELFEQNLNWAAAIARNVHRALPPSFELDDLIQEAHIQLWRCSEAFEATSGVPFQAFAYRAVRGAVLMKCRRRHWKENTHHELVTVDDEQEDSRPAAPLLSVEPSPLEMEVKPPHPRALWLRDTVGRLPAVDSYLIQRVYIDGVPEEDIAVAVGISLEGIRKRLQEARRKLRKERKTGL